MLTSVEISKYRGFPSYQMVGLAQVNLLVGKNNSGKTALLEAVQLLTSGGDPNVLDDAAKRRGELVVAGPPERVAKIDVSHFFSGHELSPGIEFVVSGDKGHRPVKVSLFTGKSQDDIDDAPTSASRASALYLKIEGGRLRKKDEQIFRVRPDGGVDLEISARRRFGVASSHLFQDSGNPPVQFVGTDSLAMSALAELWDEVTLNGFEHDVRDALRVLDPAVESIHFLSGMSAYGYYVGRAGAVIGLRDTKRRIPLGSMGDGMRRMLALATSLACARDGALFADEIDTGLHYSVMPEMWKLIINRSTATNVQVFATTHSWDCVEALSILCQREPDLLNKVAIHTIDRNLAHSVAFQGGSITRMAKYQIDPR